MAELSGKLLVSIVTPSYNQGQFIEDTILSVKNQDYLNIEHIVVDGGSTDNTLEILKKYEGTYNMRWTSKPDKGQSDALNKGFLMSSGNILAWLNSDDSYVDNALQTVAHQFLRHQGIDVLYGNVNVIDKKGQKIRELRDVPFSKRAFVYRGVNISQPAVFWRRELFFKVGALGKELRFAMDLDLWARFAKQGAHFAFVRKPLANFRIHDSSKTCRMRQGMSEEAEFVRWKHFGIKEVGSFYWLWRTFFLLRRLFWFVLQGDIDYLLSSIARHVEEAI